jgi:hypothetical protein
MTTITIIITMIIITTIPILIARAAEVSPVIRTLTAPAESLVYLLLQQLPILVRYLLLFTIFFCILLQLCITIHKKIRLYNRMIAVSAMRCRSSQAVLPLFLQMIKIIKQIKGSNNRRQGRIESKGAVTVIQAVTAILIIRKGTSKTTTRVKAYYLPSRAGRLSLANLL